MGWRRLIPNAALLAAVGAVGIAACGLPDISVSVGRSDSAEPVTAVPNGDAAPVMSDNDEPEQALVPPVSGAVDFGIGKSPRDYDAYLDAAFADIEAYWADVYEATYGGQFEPVAGIYAMYPERRDAPQSCDGPLPYELAQDNAFYTSCGDLIAYDDASLLPELVQQYGTAAVAVVAAHEYGHAIQQRAGVFDLGLPTIDTEQQADCFAGAWAAHAARGEGQAIRFDDNDVRAGLLAMIAVRDPVGTDLTVDPAGHGTAFDRVGAFQEGFLSGVDRCAAFPTDPNPRIDLPFLTAAEFRSGGDLPLDGIATALPTSLDTFWLPVLGNSDIAFTPPTVQIFPSDGPYPTCDGRPPEQLVGAATFCADTNTIAYDADRALRLYDAIGDLGYGYPVANAYSDAVQTAIGSPLTGEPRALLNDCLVGVWTYDIIPAFDAGGAPTFDVNGNPVANNPDQRITLSAGDLDEAVVTAVVVGDDTSDTDRFGTAFDKIDAFRDGVLGGLDACQARLAASTS